MRDGYVTATYACIDVQPASTYNVYLGVCSSSPIWISFGVDMSDAPLFGPYGRGAVDIVDRLSEFGANALWFHGFNPAAFDACEKHRIAPCVEFKTFRADYKARPELIPIGVDGKPIRYGRLVQGVCLSKKDFLEETERNLIDGLDAFRPAGVWLDYLTHAGWFEDPDPDLQESCFCPQCIADFCETTGTDATTPDRILQHYPKQWERHKCEKIARFAAHYSQLIRSRHPGCLIGAYMCPWTPEELDRALTRIFAQDYELMAPSLDVFTPLIYAQKCGRPPTWGRDFLEQMGRRIPSRCRVQLILDVLDFPKCLTAAADAEIPTWGVQLFGGAPALQDSGNAAIFRACVERIAQKQ